MRAMSLPSTSKCAKAADIVSIMGVKSNVEGPEGDELLRRAHKATVVVQGIRCCQYWLTHTDMSQM